MLKSRPVNVNLVDDSPQTVAVLMVMLLEFVPIPTLTRYRSAPFTEFQFTVIDPVPGMLSAVALVGATSADTGEADRVTSVNAAHMVIVK
jgi:hypothetical protein